MATTQEMIETWPYWSRGERRARAIVERWHMDGYVLAFCYREGGRWKIGGHCAMCGWSRPSDDPPERTQRRD